MWFNIGNTTRRQLAIVRWIVKQVDQQQVRLLCDQLQISPFLARLLINRGLKEPQVVYKFLNPTVDDLHDPMGLTDMDRAVSLLLQARTHRLPVLIYGDYDVDGITGVAVLKEFLDRFGWETEYYIPKRMDEGYGIQPAVIEQFCRKSKGVIVTVDCGITAFEAIEFANSFGCPVIVTDHHEIGERLPKAAAVIDPKRSDDSYPFKDLAGVGVAFKLVCAVAERIGIRAEEFFDLLEFVALGTIADMVKLVDENRFLVKAGLQKLRETKRPGLSMMFTRLCITDPDSRDIGYRVAPKLNAAGRLDCADDAFQLLLAQDRLYAERLVELLFEYNTTRQEIESDIFAHAVEQIEEYGLHKDPVIVVRGRDWHVGVIGIVATRLVHRYGRPVMVISEADGVARGSARSVPEVNLIELLQPLSSYFKEFGGHPLAVGFSLNPDGITNFIDSLRNCKIPVKGCFDIIEIDDEVQLEQIDEQVMRDLQLLEPFGHGNPEPVFLAKKVPTEFMRTFGQNHANVKMLLRINGRKVEALGFGLGYLLDKPNYESVSVDIVFSVRNHKGPLSLSILDLSLPEEIYEPAEGSEIPQKLLHLDQLLTQIKGKRLYILDIRTRNTFLYWLKEKTNIRCAVISINNIISSHLHQSLLRHVQSKISYVNSLNRNATDRFTFMTLATFMREKEKIIDQYDIFLINELSLFKVFEDQPQVEDFLGFVSRNVHKFMAMSVKNPDDLFSFAAKLGFEVSYERSLKLNYGLADISGDLDSILNDAACFLFSDQRRLSDFYRRLKDRWKNREILVYSHTLKPSQRLSVINSLRKRKPVKLVSSTNTDGLPTLLGQDLEIAILDAPLSLFELLDAVSSDGDNQLFDICFDNENILERQRELEELFPSKELVTQILSTVEIDEMSQQRFLDMLVENGYFKNPSYTKVMLNILKDLGAFVSPEKISVAKVDLSRIPLRIAERELEFAYFEKITKPLLTQKVKGIYKALANVRTVI